MRYRKKYQLRGFTLLEALLVCLIFALVAVAVMPVMYHSIQEKTTEQEAMVLLSNLRSAQLQVMREGGTAVIRVNGQGYTINYDGPRPYQKTVPLKSRISQSAVLTFQQIDRLSSRTFPATFTLTAGNTQRYIIVDSVGRIYYRQIKPEG
ncbi:MAG: type II secretion system protein [Clostridiales bacterium]|nr:type II secretion system protein [Clostridiales bacterium]